MSGGSHLPDTLQAPSAGPSFPSTGMASLMHPEVHSQLRRSDLVPMMAPSAGGTAPPLLVPCVPPPLLPGHCGTNTHTDSSDDRGKKGRLRWTPELHARFVRAVEQLGGAFTATPKRILCAMALPGLTLHQVKSHVQKYRTAVATAGKGKAKGGRKGSHLQPAEPAAPSAGPASSDEGAPGAAGRNEWLEMMEDEEGLGAPASRMQASGGSPRQQQPPGEQLGRIASFCDLGLPQGLWDGDDAPNLGGLLMEWGSDVLLAADPTSERPPPPQDAPAAAPLARSGSSRSGMSNGAAGGPPPAAAAPTASAAGAAAAAVSEVAQPASPAAVVASASTARPMPAQPGQTLLLGDGALREALRLQLEMQRQLSAALEAQRALQEQLRAHQAYIEQLLSAGEACGEEDAPTSGNANPCQAADVVLSPRATPQQQPQQQLQQQASQQQVQQQVQQPPPQQQVQQEAQQQRLLQQPPPQQQQPEQGQHHQHWRQPAGAPVSWQPLAQQQHSQHVGSLPPARQQPAPPAPRSVLQPALWQQPEPDRRRQQQALASAWPASSGGATPARPGALSAAPAVSPAAAHGLAAMQEGRVWPPRASAGPCSQSGASTYTMAAVSGASSHPPGHSFQAWGGLRSSSQAAVPGHLCGPSGGPAW